ncbi:hypothetical protein J2T13_003462 [Paenibacillus sp. DS2015]|uniref:hypothetical protein n=1 Tax=Paenibacillus sp. DS2015 TaxID=3373917 RepID=UPI003D21AD5A
MNKKKPVTIRPFLQTKYSYEKLRICNHCKSFTVLWEDQCASCGKDALMPIHTKAKIKAKRSMRNELLAALLFTLVGVWFGRDPMQMTLCAIVGILLILLLWNVQRRMLPYVIPQEMESLIEDEEARIIEGIKHNRQTAISHLQNNEVMTYEMLREISTLVHNDRIRLQQVVLLQTFILRKDMDLVIEPLLLKDFDTDLAAYIGEISKVQRDLIKNQTIRYILTYEAQILEMEHGRDIMTGVAGAAVRMKKYVDSYPEFIRRYARYLPKDRFMRLYQLIRQHPEQSWGHLAEEVSRIHSDKYTQG